MSLAQRTLELAENREKIGYNYPFYHEQFSVMIYGAKTSGKTALSLGVPGHVLVICLEDVKNVSKIIDNMYGNDRERFHIKDVSQFYKSKHNQKTRTADQTYTVIETVLKEANDFDWIIIDGFHKLTEISENKMRHDNNKKAHEGFKNLSLWKERNDNTDYIYQLAHSKAIYGVILNCHEQKEQLKYETTKDGKTVVLNEKFVEPQWRGHVKDTVRTIIYCSTFKDKFDVNQFIAGIQSCKDTNLNEDIFVTAVFNEITSNVEESPMHFWRYLLTHTNKINLSWNDMPNYQDTTGTIVENDIQNNNQNYQENTEYNEQYQDNIDNQNYTDNNNNMDNQNYTDNNNNAVDSVITDNIINSDY